MNRKIDKGALLNGLMLIAIGLLFLLDRLHIEDFGDLIRLYWPCIIILFGISHILRRESLWSGLWLVTVGVWLQLTGGVTPELAAGRPYIQDPWTKLVAFQEEMDRQLALNE